ncbi:MSHA biogenesis protein MshK [Photobacterium makurazakiensis]|uniref:MSHA biogenesis protein MshK n=1 Tax=Photobacterium TaxID=657 RepID=UPI003D13DEA2
MVKSILIVIGVNLTVIGGALAKQDPTAPLGWQAPAVKSAPSRARLPQLQGIFCEQSGSNCTVILNDSLVSRGGRVSGYTLDSIQDDFVILRRGSKQWRLELFADNVKSD